MNTSATILDNTFNCIFQTDSNLNITYWNNATEIVSGILQKDAIGQYIFDLIPSLSNECEYYFKEAILKEGRTIELHLHKFTAPVSQNKIAVRARYLPHIVAGKVIGVYGIWKQLSYDYEERDYLNLLKSVILNAHDAVMITRALPIDAPEGPVIIYSNPALIKTDDSTQHSGVGLAICKNIIEKHKGKITVVSQVGIGSTFTLQIPKSK